jgi:hypothetical protein
MNQIVTNSKNSKTIMQVKNHKLKVRLVMRTAFLALCAVLFALPAKAQQLPDPFNMTRGTYTVQNQKVYKFYDSGGPDLYTPEEDPNNDYNWVTWYQPNEDITVTLNPGTAGYGVQVDFSFDKAYLNINNDYLSFYDGSTASEANLIGTFSCNDFFVSSPGITGFKVQSHGVMTIVFTSDGRFNAEGWNAQISLVQNYTPQPPVVLRSKCNNTIQLFPTTKGQNTSQYFYTLPNGSEQEYTLGASIDVDSYTFPLSVSARSKIDGTYSSPKSYSIASKVQAYNPPTYVHDPGNNTVTPWFIAKPESLRDTYYIRYYIGNNPGTDPNTWPSNQEFRQPDYTYEPVAAGDINYSSYVPPFTVAMALRGTTCNTLFSEIVSVTISEIAVVKPTITFGTGNTTTATLACDMTAPEGKSIRMFYTTDGSTPTLNSTLYEGAITNITAGMTVKAIAVMMEQNEGQWVQSPGYGISAVASEMYLPGGEGQSGVYGDVVLLDDREDHSWSYYSDGDQPIHSLNPADVKITYFGNGKTMTGADYTAGSTAYVTSSGVKVGVDANANTFVYLKTLERTDGATSNNPTGRCEYTAIPNPFSVRPTYNSDQTTTWRGFQCWRLKAVRGGDIYEASTAGTALTEGAIVNAEQTYYFAPADETGMEVELEAIWARAYVTVANNDQANNIQSQNVGYERNFVVLASDAEYRYGGNNGRRIGNTGYAVTISNRYPDGTIGNANARMSNNDITLAANVKFEYTTLNLTSTTLTANKNDLILGRSINGTINHLRGISGGTTSLDYMLRVESGTINRLTFVGTSGTISDRYLVKSIMGCDFDRANNDNNKLSVSNDNDLFYSTGVTFSNSNNRYEKTFDLVVKSGKYQESYWYNQQEAPAGQGQPGGGGYKNSFYCGQNSSNNTYSGIRYVTVEGGEFGCMNGGRGTSANSATMQNYVPDMDTPSVTLRIKNGTFHGAIYGGAADSQTAGSRAIIITGGEVQSWVAGANNGTGTQQGSNAAVVANTYVYVGGNATIGGDNPNVVNETNGGQVYGAGRGMSGQAASVVNSYVVIADNASVLNKDNDDDYPIGGNVYGGGNYGYVTTTSNVYILGGTIQKHVFGGAYGNGTTIPRSNVYVKGGKVEGSVYGGSNSSGTVGTNGDNKATVNVSGGTVKGSVFGGGLGVNTVMGNGTVVVVSGAETLIEGNVYGGGELGTVSNGGTDVTLNGATVNDVFGAGLGNEVSYNLSQMNSANVVGNTKVTVLNGKAYNVYGGSAFGSVNYNNANNYSPNANYTSTVTVMGGTIQQDPADKENTGNVYGGGSKGLTQNNTIVNVQGGVIENSVYGGALGTTGHVYVGGKRTVNMAGGHVYNNVYAGSRNADDAQRLANYTTYQPSQPANVVNMSGGHVDYQVFAAGFFGHTYGSVYAFIGQNAINNAPNNQPTDGFNYNITNLSIDGNVWAGADYGNFDGTSFGDPTVEGNSNIYIDGTGYDTETHNTTGGSYMSINGSVFGTGTSCYAGKLDRNIIVRKYGLVQENPDFVENDITTEKYSGTTRSLYSIQYATRLVIDDAHITFEGQGQISSLVNTEKYSVFMFDDMRVVNGSTLILKYPVDEVKAVGSYSCSDVYGANPTYNTIGINGLTATDNKIRVNNGSVLYIRYTKSEEDSSTHEITEKTQYGTLTGYLHMMTDDVNLTCAYARPKWGEGAPFDAGDEDYDNPDDGGFVSYHPIQNPFDEDGNEVGQPNGVQIAYENHTPSRNGEDYFRIWLYGDKYSFREKVFNAQAKNEDGYSVASVVVNLPSRQDGSFYRIKQQNGFTTINYGEDVMTVNAGSTEYDVNNNTVEDKWMKFNGSETAPAFLYDQSESDMGNQLDYLDNSTFGLVAVPQGSLVASTNKDWLINEAADEYLATDACKWMVNDQTQEPSIEFLLTYNNRLSSNMTWDPITIVVQQFAADGTTVLDEVTIELTVITSTSITQTFTAQTYAIMRGNGLPNSSFSTKVVLPEYTLYVDQAGRPSTWTFKSATFDPGEVGTNSSWQLGEAYIHQTASDNQFSMTMTPGYNKDNTIGWDTHNDTDFDLKSTEAHEFGYTYGRSPIAFDFVLHYDGRASVDQKKLIGTLNVILTFTNYKNASQYYPEGSTTPNTDMKQDVLVQVEVWRVGNGTNYYLDGVNGNNFFAGDRPNAAKKTLNGILHHSEYLPGDNIFIVNTVTANGNATLNWDGEDLGGILIYRYPGGHQLSESTDPNEVFLGWNTGENPYNPDNIGFAKELVNVEKSMVMHGILLDGSHEIVQSTNPSLYPVEGKYVEPTAPLVKVAAGAELSVYANSKMQHNYANADGGAIYNEGKVNALRGTEISHNAVKSGKNGGGIYQKEGATLQLSDVVTIDNNYIYNGDSKADVLGDNNNVYLEKVTNVINVGTLNPNDNYIPLDNSSKIGVTKAEWGPNYYTEVVYSDGDFDNYLNNVLENGLVYDDEGMYDLVRLNISDNYLYFVGTWVTAQKVNPQDEEHPNNFDASIIATDKELAWLISYVNGLNGADAHPNAVATLIADIDMDKHIWVPIGEDAPFGGKFNGNGHVVTGIRSPLNGTNMAMFGSTTDGAEISNLIASVNFAEGVVSNMGSVVGTMNGGLLSNIEAAGTISGASTTQNVGGVVGKVEKGTIHSAFAVNTMTGGANTVIGGLVGTNAGNLFNSYANVTLGEGNEATTIGGLVGDNKEHSIVENCYVINPIGPAFAAINSGTINYCYAAEGTSTYVGSGSTGTLDGHGTYEAVKGRKEIGYMYDDNKVTANNNYVADKIYYTKEEGEATVNVGYITKWPGLLSTLNQWVKANPRGIDNLTPWFRSTSSYLDESNAVKAYINGDLPILGFPKDNSLATEDGKFLYYGACDEIDEEGNQANNGLDNLFETYADKEANMFLYGKAVDVTKGNGDNMLFINEDAVLLQKEATNGKAMATIKAVVGITFENSSKSAHDYYGNLLEYDWHLMSTPLRDAPLGITYTDNDVHNWWENEDDGQVDAVSGSYMPDGIDESDVKWDFYTYFEPEYHWINFKRNINSHHHYDEPHDPITYTGTEQNENGVLTPGRGYMMAISNDSYLSNNGTLNNGEVPMPLTVSGTLPETELPSKDWGSNLVGNPYQAYLDLSKVPAKNGFYVYNADNGVYGPYMTGASVNPVLPSEFIHPHQGFFVVTTVADPNFKFTYNMATATPNETSYFRGEEQPRYPVVNLFAENETGNRDLAIIELNRSELDGVRKVNNLRNANFKIAAHLEGTSYGLVFTPEGTDRVPVRFITDEDGTFTLTWSTFNGDFSSLLLVDNMTGTITDMLRSDHYTFDATTDDYASRFYITFAVTDVEEYNEGDNDFAWFDGSEWVINGKGNLDVVDVLGRTIYSTRLTNDQNRVNLNNVAKGVYMLRVSEGTSTKVQKVVVR